MRLGRREAKHCNRSGKQQHKHNLPFCPVTCNELHNGNAVGQIRQQDVQMRRSKSGVAIYPVVAISYRPAAAHGGDRCRDNGENKWLGGQDSCEERAQGRGEVPKHAVPSSSAEESVELAEVAAHVPSAIIT